MSVIQTTREEALRLAAAGQNIMLLRPYEVVSNPKEWTDYRTCTLDGMLEGCLFFREKLSDAELQPEENKDTEPVAENQSEDAGTSSSPAETAKPGRLGKPGRNKVQLDTGKVLALHRAGWTLAKIANEMKCSIPTIANCLKEMKKTDEGNGEDRPG